MAEAEAGAEKRNRRREPPDHRAEAGHPPQRQVDGGGIVVHQIGKAPLQQGGGLPGVVVRNAWVDVMAQVGGADAVVQEV